LLLRPRADEGRTYRINLPLNLTRPLGERTHITGLGIHHQLMDTMFFLAHKKTPAGSNKEKYSNQEDHKKTVSTYPKANKIICAWPDSN